MDFDVIPDDLSDGKVIALLQEHLEEMHRLSPAESVHALDLQAMRSRDISFWSAREGTHLAGCGALKEIQTGQGEIKSMKTSPFYLRQGAAAAVLSAIIAEARLRGYTQLFLETGTQEAFKPAIALYSRFGFAGCGPFGDYREDPYSRFMRLDL